MTSEIEKLIKKASDAHDATEAMKYAQAALSVAQTICLIPKEKNDGPPSGS